MREARSATDRKLTPGFQAMVRPFIGVTAESHPWGMTTEISRKRHNTAGEPGPTVLICDRIMRNGTTPVRRLAHNRSRDL